MDVSKGNYKLIEMGAKPLREEMLDDKNTVLYNWLNNNKNIIPGEQEYIQLGMFDINQEGSYAGKSDSVDNKIAEDIQDSYCQKTDLYEIVWPYFERALQEPKSDAELSKMFNINQNQLND